LGDFSQYDHYATTIMSFERIKFPNTLLEIRKKISVIGFQKRVDAFAQELKANNYFCGYEPAADEETRLFSGSTLGPLNNWRDLDE